MKKILLTVLAIGSVAAVMLFAGCSGGGSETIAVVGDKKITVKEYEEWAASVMQPFPTREAELEKRRQALDSMIVTELLVQAAYEHRIDQSEEVARVMLANRPKFLLDALYTREVIDKTEVTDAEIKLFYDRLENKMRACQVLVADPDTAQMLLERIKGGADIEQVAYEYSIDPSAKRNRGDIGYFIWGAMVDEFQEAVIQMEVGEISPPVKSIYGYHIIKLVDKAPNEARQSFDEMEASISNQILGRKRYEITDAYFRSIREKYPIEIDPSPCDYVLAKREQLYPPQLLEKMPRSDFDIEQLDRNERELILATWEGGQVSIGEYLSQIQNIPIQYRPDLDNYDSLKSIVFELKKQDILTYEAILLGLDTDPGLQRKLNRFKDLAMAEMMKNDSIQMPPLPTDADAREYYDTHPSEFSNPAKVHIYEILVSDELQAQKLATEIRSLEDFKDKARKLTERPGKRAVSGDLGFIEREYFPEIFDRAWKTALGGIADPVFVNGKYSVAYVVDRSGAELKDFLGLKRDIIQKLSVQKAVETFTQWVEDRKQNTNIEIYDDVLESTIDQSKYSVDTSEETLG